MALRHFARLGVETGSRVRSEGKRDRRGDTPGLRKGRLQNEQCKANRGRKSGRGVKILSDTPTTRAGAARGLNRTPLLAVRAKCLWGRLVPAVTAATVV